MGETQGQLYSPNKPTSKKQNYKLNKRVKSIILDKKNSGTNYVGKYTESLSLYKSIEVYKLFMTKLTKSSK